MSYYYNYTIGYELEGKIYPLGPYTSFGKLRDVVSRSRSFASDLYELFYPIPDEKVSDELRKQFEYTNWNNETVMQDVKYLYLDNLPQGRPIKSGYFLITDVQMYEEGVSPFDGELFYEHLTPTTYAARCVSEAKFGPPKPQKDCEGFEIPVHPASDYMFYAYLDTSSEEYEAQLIRDAADILTNDGWDLPKGARCVILETEG